MRKFGIATIAASMIAALLFSTPAHAQAAAAPIDIYSGTGTVLAHDANDQSPFVKVVADPTHNHIFVAAQAASGVMVTDLDGALVTTLPSTADARGMALSADGASLYIALRGSNEIRVINTAKLTGRSISLSEGTRPYAVAVASGLVWYAGSSGVGALDPATGRTWPNLIAGSSVLLASSPALEGALFVGTNNFTPASLAISRYNVIGGTAPTASYVVSHNEFGTQLFDMAITSDGTHLIAADDLGQGVQQNVLFTSDLTTDSTIQTSWSKLGAAAAGPNGTVAVGGPNSSPTFEVFEAGSDQPAYRISTPTNTILPPGGLTMAAGSAYAVTNSAADGLVLHVVPISLQAPLSIGADSAEYGYGATATITANLTGADPASAVSVYATPVGGTRTLVTSGNFANDAFSASYPVTRTTTFTVSYAGDSTYGPTEKSTTVSARAKVATSVSGGYRTSGSYALVHKAKSPRVTANVAPSHAGDCVSFQTQILKSRRWVAKAKSACRSLSAASRATVTLSGTLTGKHVVGQKLRVRAVWKGDDVNLAANSGWSYVKFTR